MNICPPIDSRLIDYLNTLYPERSPTENETERKMLWRGGQTSVVRKLKQLLEEQENGTSNVFSEPTET